jgi:4,4'-diaponeurosporenoate glycosyltransferase
MILLILIVTCAVGFILFKPAFLETPQDTKSILPSGTRISVIIPARNEEKNLPLLLNSLKEQTLLPDEIIVIDDFSTDRTAGIAMEHGVSLIRNTSLPEGWTGKTWAVWQGYLQSTGDVLVFLDADVRLAPQALRSLVYSMEKSASVISVVPYHRTEKFYERFSLLPCLLGVFAFASPFERENVEKGLYGACIVTKREDYEKINGHNSISGELLDDLSLGRKFTQAGIRITNFIGGKLVWFRMYPGGLRSEIQGFGKGAVLSTATLHPATAFCIAIWLIGLLATEILTPIFLVTGHPWGIYGAVGYLLYTVQIIWFNRSTGRYGMFIPLIHILSSGLFIYIMLYSVYFVTFRGYVIWKGRKISVKKE